MNWVSFLAYVVVMAITPGPNNITSMNNAVTRGFRKGLPYNLGIFTGIAIIMILSALFSTVLYTLVPVVQTPIKILGAAYLLFLAYKTVTPAFRKKDVDPRIKSEGDTADHKDDLAGLVPQKKMRALFVSGILIQFLNPKIMLYGITAMSGWIVPHFPAWYFLLAFVVFLAFMGFVCTLLWSAFGALLRGLFSRRAKLIGVIMAALLVYCAVSLFF